MKISELKSRWTTSEGYNRRENILKALKYSTPLDGYTEVFNNRWDLRGIKLSTPQIRKKTFSNYTVFINDQILEFKNVNLQDIDFSHADLSYTLWTNCDFKNLLMHSTNFANVKLCACSMRNCEIEKTNFSNSLLGSRLKKNSGYYENVVFKNSNFKNSAYSFPLFSNCSFIDCNLKDVNFDGSRFENCVFKGLLYSPIFRGVTTKYEKRIFWERSVNPYDFPNKMLNVDFSEAQLRGVSFIDGVDISTCIFPKQGDYLIINDVKSVYSQARNIIEQEWSGEDKRIGLALIDRIYFNEHHKSQKQDIIDKEFLIKDFSEYFAYRFYSLIEKLNTMFS